MRLVIPPGVFRPRSDTWMLADAAKAVPRPPGGAALELCTGSGAVAATLARAGWRTTAVDLSRRAVLAAAINGRGRVRARRGDLFAAVPGERFDLIVSNPPYIPSEAGPEAAAGELRHIDGGHDGRVLLDRILLEAPDHLRPGGTVLVIHSDFNGVDASLDALREGGLVADVCFRHRGPLGPIVRGRAELLVQRGLLAPDAEEEEVVVVRGVAA